MDDLVFYEVVMEKRKADDAYLITGNLKHFPNTRVYRHSSRDDVNSETGRITGRCNDG